ncbi:MAG: phosphoglucosamine mutase [Planctomycetota bacterium]
MTTAAPTSAPLMLSVSGCRGIVGQSLTPPVAARYARAIARWAIEQRTPDSPERPSIVLARDGRLGGHAYEAIVAGSLAAAGLDVIRLGVATTPTVGVMVNHLQADAGVQITASHNPQTWNGIKTIDRTGAAPPKMQADQIIASFHAEDPADWSVDVGYMTERHDGPSIHARRAIDAIASIADIEGIRAADHTAVIDSVNASGGPAARCLLEQLGVHTHFLFDDGSGMFPHTPEPLAENLVELCESVAKDPATTIGFAQDPDADRLAIVDERGQFIGEEYTLALCTLAMQELTGQNHTVVTNLSTSRMVDDLTAAANNGKTMAVRAPVGEANVVEVMRRIDAPLAGEGNGGVIWPAVVPIRDSLGAMALVLALMTKRNQPLSTIVAEITPYAIVKRKMPIAEGLTEVAFEAAASAFPHASQDHQDGLRLDMHLDDGTQAWVHVRPSNTEPILRLIGEAHTEDTANVLLHRIEQAIENAKHS